MLRRQGQAAAEQVYMEEIAAEDLAPGDVLVLGSGDLVHSDAASVSASSGSANGDDGASGNGPRRGLKKVASTASDFLKHLFDKKNSKSKSSASAGLTAASSTSTVALLADAHADTADLDPECTPLSSASASAASATGIDVQSCAGDSTSGSASASAGGADGAAAGAGDADEGHQLDLPCDCVVLEGQVIMNESNITGEPVPV